MTPNDDPLRNPAQRTPNAAAPAAGFQSQASRAAAPAPTPAPTTSQPGAIRTMSPANATKDPWTGVDVSNPNERVSVQRQLDGTTSFSGMRVGAGPVRYDSGNTGFKPGGTVNSMSSSAFTSAAPSRTAALGEARQSALARGDLDAVGRSFQPMGAPSAQSGASLPTNTSSQADRFGFNREQAQQMLREATTKRAGESRADFATRSGAIQRFLGMESDERGNMRGNDTQVRGQNLGFATSEAERQSREMQELRRQRLDAQRVGLDAGRLQLDAYKAGQPEAQKAPSGYRWTEAGDLQPIPGGPGDKAQTLRPLPSSAASGLLENRRNARRAVDALALLNGETLPGGVQGDKEATGLKGYLPNQLLNRLDPNGVDTRAAIADLGSMVINDRSGAAVTAAEFPRLAPFIPSEKDDPDTARKKLQNFARNYGALVNDTEEFYRAGGYNVPGEQEPQPANRPAATQAQPAQPAGAPQAGQVVRGYRFLGGDPADRNNWEFGQ